MSIHLKDRIKAMSLDLPPAPEPSGVYTDGTIIQNHLYVSGQGPVLSDGSLMYGKVGSELNKDEGKVAARQGWPNNAFHHYNTHFRILKD